MHGFENEKGERRKENGEWRKGEIKRKRQWAKSLWGESALGGTKQYNSFVDTITITTTIMSAPTSAHRIVNVNINNVNSVSVNTNVNTNKNNNNK